MSKAKKRLKNFDFSGDGSHVALVHRVNGGPANGVKTLITKSTDVIVELSMAEFLSRFFDMWSDDAVFVARMLGYSDDIESLWNNEELMDKVQVLTKAKEDLSSGQMADSKELREITKSLAQHSNVQITDLDVTKNADGVSDMPVGENVETPEEVNKSMTDNVEMIEKSAAESMIAEAIEKAVAKVESDKNAEIETLRKSLADFEEAQKKEKLASFVTKAKEFEALGVEDFDSFGETLMKMSETEGFEKINEVLEKALNVVKNADGFTVEGSDVDIEVAEESGTAKLLKAKYQNQ